MPIKKICENERCWDWDTMGDPVLKRLYIRNQGFNTKKPEWQRTHYWICPRCGTVYRDSDVNDEKVHSVNNDYPTVW